MSFNMAIHEEIRLGAERDLNLAPSTYICETGKLFLIVACGRKFQHQRSVWDVRMSPDCAHPRTTMLPPNSSPPASSSSTRSIPGHGFHPYRTHARSASSSTHSRSDAPASLSTSCAVVPPSPPTGFPTPTPSKPRKSLNNKRRKEICKYALGNPDARQEDIATKFDVDRSTVCKILKEKNKWLRLSDGDVGLIEKYR